jgi:hypothetical protein
MITLGRNGVQIVRNFLEKNEFAVLERVASTVYAAVDKCEAPPDLQDQVAAWGGIGGSAFSGYKCIGLGR